MKNFSIFVSLIIVSFYCYANGDDSIDRENIRRFPKESFRYINQSIDRNLMRYGNRIRETRAIINRAESINLIPYNKSFNLPLPYEEKINLDLRKPEVFFAEPKEPEPVQIDEVKPKLELQQESQVLEEFRSVKARSGLYILPTLGIQFPQSVDLNAPFGVIGLQNDTGFAVGLTFGKKWEKFFLELDLSYLQNHIAGFEDAKSYPSTFLFDQGDINTFKIFINGGGRITIGDRASFDLGGGVGLANQNICLNYDFVIPFQQENTKSCFAIQALAGFKYEVTERFLFGLDYKSIWISEMNDFSKRNIHMIELIGGYSF